MSFTIGAVIAACSLAIGSLAYAVKISMFAGRLETRVIHLEGAASDNKEVRDLVIKMAERQEHMNTTLEKLSQELVWMTKSAPMYGPPAPAPATPRPTRARKT